MKTVSACFFCPATAAVLRQVKDLPRNLYKVDVDVKDLQSNGGIQTALVRICQCRNGACVPKEHSAALGSLAWLAMLLPLALLLLLCEFHTLGPAPEPNLLQNKPRVPVPPNSPSANLASSALLCAGLLMAFLCVTKKEKMEMEDVGDSGGILLKSNTEAPGEEVVKTCSSASSGSTSVSGFHFIQCASRIPASSPSPPLEWTLELKAP